MKPTRTCRSVPLSKQPLALVLIQTRFSPILNISDYVPKIQDSLRKLSFPLFVSKTSAKLEPSLDGIRPIPITQWRFETSDQRTSIILDQDQILLQTTNYHSFEEFISLYISVLSPVLDITKHASFGLVERLGLRYVDQVTLQGDNDDIDSYLRPGLRGTESPYFKNTLKRYSYIDVGDTVLRSRHKGTLSVRVLRNFEHLDLPSDLFQEAPIRAKNIDVNKDFALIDMDHGCERPFPTDTKGINPNELEELYFGMHDIVIEVFHGAIVTEEGIKKWQ